MMHIVDFCWSDDVDAALFARLERQDHQDHRSGPCDDDYEIKCPYVGMLPEESGLPDGSPLRFRDAEIDWQIQQALKLGL